MTAPVAITIESVEFVGPFVIQTSGNVAYVGIRPDLFYMASALGTIEFLLQDAYRAPSLEFLCKARGENSGRQSERTYTQDRYSGTENFPGRRHRVDISVANGTAGRHSPPHGCRDNGKCLRLGLALNEIHQTRSHNQQENDNKSSYKEIFFL